MLPYSWQNVVLVVVQAALVALPAAGLPAIARRFVGRSWSLVLPASIVVVVAGLAVLPGAAIGLTWLALLGVPILAAATVGWAMHGARPWLAVLAVPVFAIAVAYEGRTPGDVAALSLTALSCVSLARLLAGVVAGDPGSRSGLVVGASGSSSGEAASDGGRRSVGVEGSAGSARAAAGEGVRRSVGVVRRPSGLTWIRVALVAMAVIDAILVFSSALEGPNATLNAAVPAAQLPRLQFVTFEGASMGYGDVFVAAVLGAVLAAEGAGRRVQLAAAGTTLVLSLIFDLLFAFDSINTLPATVPVAVATLLFGGWRGWGGRPGWHGRFGWSAWRGRRDGRCQAEHVAARDSAGG